MNECLVIGCTRIIPENIFNRFKKENAWKKNICRPCLSKKQIRTICKSCGSPVEQLGPQLKLFCSDPCRNKFFNKIHNRKSRLLLNN